MGRGNYIGGRFLEVGSSSVAGEVVSESPRELGRVLGRYPIVFEHVEQAVRTARTAFGAWSQQPLSVRAEAMRKLGQALAAREDDLARLIAQEVGKPLWEARGEVRAAVAKVEVTLEAGLALVSEVGETKASYSFRPHGVAAVVGPFNFPLHLVHGHVVPALATGNTVIVKPSELAPGVGELYAEVMDAAGLPAGVFNMVQGGGEVGEKLCAHAGVDAVMFTGSYHVGQAIRRATFEQPGKLLALEMGGRNPALVLGDAPLEKAVHDVVWGAFVSAGQRCSGTAVALVEASCFDAFRERLLRRVEALRVGDPLQQDVFMGPLVSAAARERFEAQLMAAEGSGVEAWIASARPSVSPDGAYVSPSVHHVERGAAHAGYAREELFGPDLAIERVGSLEEAIDRANDSDYGLSASVFTQDESRFRRAHAQLRYGCVNWNAPTCGASSRLPFGGLKKSGNHRPAALFSTLYCTYPVASLTGGDELNVAGLSPGMNWG